MKNKISTTQTEEQWGRRKQFSDFQVTYDFLCLIFEVLMLFFNFNLSSKFLTKKATALL